MKLSEKQSQFLQDICMLVMKIHSDGNYCTGGELHRIKETQQILKEQGKSQTSDGQHQKRLAMDIFLFINGKVTWDSDDYQRYGEFWEAIRPENRWGGNFPGFVDAVHFERYD